MVIPTLPYEPLFWHDLARCDNFSESQENDGSDICMVVGEIPTFWPAQISLIPQLSGLTTRDLKLEVKL